MRVIAYKKSNSNWKIMPNLQTTIVYSGDIIMLLGTAKELSEFESKTM